MKWIFTAALAVLLAACAPRNEWRLTGEIKGLDGVALLYMQDNANLNLDMGDTVRITGGRVNIRGVADRPMVGKLIQWTQNGNQIDVSMLGTFIVEPGAKLKIDGDMSWDNGSGGSKGYVTGNPTNDRLNAFLKAIDQNIEDYVRLRNEYIESNTDNLGGVLMFDIASSHSGRDDVPEGAEQLFERFTPEMQATPMMVAFKEKLARVKEKQAAFGSEYREVVSTTPEGKELKLSEVIAANKLTLIDFWASWCGPCLAELPHLKEAYAEYRSKGFEIFGISLDDDATAWKSSIADNEMFWPQVSSLMGWKEPAAVLYGVQSIPANWLIDGHGNIVARNLRGKALIEKVEEILE